MGGEQASLPVIPGHTARAGQPPGSSPAALRRLLVVKLADLGDAFGIEPALASLRAAYPTATIDLLVTPGARLALATCPAIDEIIDFNKYLFDRPASLLQPRPLLAAARFLLGLRRRQYDAVLLFHHLSTSWGAIKFEAVCRIIGAQIIAGLDNGRGRFLTHSVVDLGFGAYPDWQYWLAVVGQLGVTPLARLPRFTIPAEAQVSAARLVRRRTDAGRVTPRRPLIALHTGVGGYAPLKQWPLERFAALARQLIDVTGGTLLLVGGPQSDPFCGELAGQLGESVIDLTGRTSLAELAALLGQCDLTIGNDSSVVHLAAIVGCRTLALFGPTNAAAWAPPGAQIVSLPVDGDPTALLDNLLGRLERPTVALRVDEPCSPCYYTGYTVQSRGICLHRNCLHHLQPATVTMAAQRLLSLSKQS